MTQHEFAELTGIPFNTLKSIESGQRSLTDAILFEVVLATGAEWDEVHQEWIASTMVVDEREPFSRDFYEWFQKGSVHVPPAEYVDRTREWLNDLFKVIPEEDRPRLVFRIGQFLQQIQRDFHVVPEPRRKKARPKKKPSPK